MLSFLFTIRPLGWRRGHRSTGQRRLTHHDPGRSPRSRNSRGSAAAGLRCVDGDSGLPAPHLSRWSIALAFELPPRITDEARPTDGSPRHVMKGDEGLLSGPL